MKNVLVTGATGYLGGKLVNHLVKNGWNTHILIRESTNTAAFKAIISKLNICFYDGTFESIANFLKINKIDVVFHLASYVVIDHHSSQVDELISSNVRLGTQLLEAMKVYSVRYFVNTGTSWQNFQNQAYNPVNLYAATKQAFEDILLYYSEAGFIKSLSLRLYDVYGKDDSRPKLINQLIKTATDDSILHVTPGEQKIDLVHIDDVCNAYLSAYDFLNSDHYQDKHEVFGVSSGMIIEVNELIQMFEDVLNKKLNIAYGKRQYRQREVMEPPKLNRLPNWTSNKDIKSFILSVIKE